MSGVNQDSVRGLQGNGYNCSIIAMDNCGLIPDATGLTKGGMRNSQLERNLMKQAHIIEVAGFRVPPYCSQVAYNSKDFGSFGRCSIRQFAKRHPEGIFITASHNHFAAVVDGVIHNSRRNQRVKWAWRIVKKEPGER